MQRAELASLTSAANELRAALAAVEMQISELDQQYRALYGKFSKVRRQRLPLAAYFDRSLIAIMNHKISED